MVSFHDYELLNALNLFLVYFFSKFCVIYKEVFIFKKYNIINLALEHQVKAEKILFNQGYQCINCKIYTINHFKI